MCFRQFKCWCFFIIKSLQNTHSRENRYYIVFPLFEVRTISFPMCTFCNIVSCGYNPTKTVNQLFYEHHKSIPLPASQYSIANVKLHFDSWRRTETNCISNLLFVARFPHFSIRTPHYTQRSGRLESTTFLSFFLFR